MSDKFWGYIILAIIVFFIAWGAGFIFTPVSGWHTGFMSVFAIIFLLFVAIIVVWAKSK